MCELWRDFLRRKCLHITHTISISSVLPVGSVIEGGNMNFTFEELQSLKWLSDVLKQIVRPFSLMY